MKCPYCKLKIKYDEAILKNNDQYCPNCNRKIVYTMTIHPFKRREWGKPYFEPKL